MSDSPPVDLLSGLKAELEERDRLGRRRDRVRADLEGLKERLRGLRKRLAKEGEDVARLEKTSLRSIFHSAIGVRDERLRKERTEHLAARSELLAALSEKGAIEKELGSIEAGLERSVGSEERHADLLRKLGTTDDATKSLIDVCDRKGRAEIALREIDEASRAARAVFKALADLRETLRSAELWGLADVLGGGLLVTAAKHGKLREAWSRVVRVRTLTRRLRRELNDVAIAEVPRLEVGKFLALADYFYDGLLADSLVQAKVMRTQKQVEKAQVRIDSILRRLRDRRANVQAELRSIRGEMSRQFATNPSRAT